MQYLCYSHFPWETNAILSSFIVNGSLTQLVDHLSMQYHFHAKRQWFKFTKILSLNYVISFHFLEFIVSKLSHVVARNESQMLSYVIDHSPPYWINCVILGMHGGLQKYITKCNDWIHHENRHYLIASWKWSKVNSNLAYSRNNWSAMRENWSF